MKKKLLDLENVFCGRTLQVIAVSFFFFYISISQVLAVNNNYAQNKKLTILVENTVQQSHKVTGKVTDENNETLPGVNVVEKGTTHGTTTDRNGDFTISVRGSGAVLVFSFVGYQTKEIQVGNRKTISLQLEKNIQNLQQVVVMGYGTQKIKDVTGAISTVSSKEIKDRPVLQLANALEGKMAGVEVITPSENRRQEHLYVSEEQHQ